MGLVGVTVAVHRDIEETRTPARERRVYDGRAELRVIEAAPPLVREDALPEHATYRDTGCEISPMCQQCPLARCKYEEPGGAHALWMSARDREISKLRRRHGVPVDMLADTYGLSRRSIFRILRGKG